jgi:hypothetical protein
MALSDKNIVITPNTNSTNDPAVEFSGASANVGPQTISVRIYPDSNGTLSFEGSAGQLFSITNDLSGTIFSVNDVSGIPSIEVLDTGLIKLAEYGGNVEIGKTGSSAKVFLNGVETGFSGFSGRSGFSGINGATGTSGFSGISGYSGRSGFSGINGATGTSGFSGYSGLNGPSTAINATNTTAAGTYYPVFVAAAGSNQTPRVRTTAVAFSFNPGTGEVAATDFNSLSDETLKNNIQSIENPMDVISKLNPVSFNWNNMDKKSFGFIAQEIEKILPEIVTETQGMKALSYTQIIPFLVEAIKELQKQIDDMKSK